MAEVGFALSLGEITLADLGEAGHYLWRDNRGDAELSRATGLQIDVEHISLGLRLGLLPARQGPRELICARRWATS
jgi:hypothetical protein